VHKTFREWNPSQQFLLPPSVEDFVPQNHMAHFVRNLVVDELDLGEIFASYKGDKGYPPFHPAMMTALLLYAYAQGIYSSRRIAQACEQRVDFMAITGTQRPDFRTVNAFRGRHLEALRGLFLQVLRLCKNAGLVKLGHVALDGTKVKANASKHSAMSYGRMKEKIPQFEAEIRHWFERADQEDRHEDGAFGADKRGDELPDWVQNRQRRLEKMKEAKAALEKEQQEKDGPEDDPPPSGGSKKPKRRHGVPDDKVQRNFTDPDSRIMIGSEGFVQSYNAQAAVDASSQVIVAHGLTNCAVDNGQLLPMVHAIKANLGRHAREISADKGFLSEANLEQLKKTRVRAFIATGRQRHGEAAPIYGQPSKKPLTRQMTRRLQQGGWRSRYRLRKQTVEPVFGQIKEARRFRRFSLRGQHKVAAEWSLICTVHNLLKLAAAR